jgi:hypothetical protein
VSVSRAILQYVTLNATSEKRSIPSHTIGPRAEPDGRPVAKPAQANLPYRGKSPGENSDAATWSPGAGKKRRGIFRSGLTNNEQLKYDNYATELMIASGR